MKLVTTDNFGGDYPNEFYIGLPNTLSLDEAEVIANILNKHVSGIRAPRFIKVVDNGYELVPVFEP